MKQIALLTILFSVFLSFPAEAQTNRPSFFPHGVVVSGNVHAVTAYVERLVLTREDSTNDLKIFNSGIAYGGREFRFEDWSVTTTETVFRLSADLLDGYDSTTFAYLITNIPSSVTSPPPNPDALTFFEHGRRLLIWFPWRKQWGWFGVYEFGEELPDQGEY